LVDCSSRTEYAPAITASTLQSADYAKKFNVSTATQTISSVRAVKFRFSLTQKESANSVTLSAYANNVRPMENV
jgi:hypothetical protein